MCVYEILHVYILIYQIYHRPVTIIIIIHYYILNIKWKYEIKFNYFPNTFVNHNLLCNKKQEDFPTIMFGHRLASDCLLIWGWITSIFKYLDIKTLLSLVLWTSYRNTNLRGKSKTTRWPTIPCCFPKHARFHSWLHWERKKFKDRSYMIYDRSEIAGTLTRTKYENIPEMPWNISQEAYEGSCYTRWEEP
jgi:hypothetical protein